MPVVLDILALPRAQASRTRRLHDAFFEAYRGAHGDVDVVQLDLGHEYDALPAFDEWDISAKFEVMYGQGRLSPEEARRWDALTRFTDQLHAADLVVISSPMWNFTIPWMLKRWIDVVVQPRLTFEIGEHGFVGLLQGRPAVLLMTRDGAYGEGTEHVALDFQKPYLEAILGVIGLGPFHSVIAQPMALGGPSVAKQALEAAIARARELAASL